MNIAAWLVAMVGPLAAQVLIALGLTAVTFTGGTAALSALRTIMLDHVSGVPASVVQLLGLLGVWEALGIWFGAMAFVLAYAGAGQVVRFVRAA
jgi:hypothetical protein